MLLLITPYNFWKLDFAATRPRGSAAMLPWSKLTRILFAATHGHAAMWLRGHDVKTPK